MGEVQSLTGKVALTSGSYSGIGASIARLLSERGCAIAVSYPFASEHDAAEEVLASLAPGTKGLAIEADLSIPAGATWPADHTAEHFEHIDTLVNNAGVAGDGLLPDITLNSWDRVINLSAHGTLLLIQAVLPYLSKKSSRIINIASVTARDMVPGISLYAGSKAMVETFTKRWAKELPRQYGCTVNAVVPGPVQRPMMDAAPPEFKDKLNRFVETAPVEPRMATGEDMAWVVAMLCEEGAGWVNGPLPPHLPVNKMATKPKKQYPHGLTPGQGINTAPKPKPKPSGNKPPPTDARQTNASSQAKGFSETERRRETAKAANQALKLQRQAQDLTQAAAGAGDPEERQKLLNEALNKSVEAESFGKTAKYMQTGAFQGLMAGGGLGTGIGVGLGTITGTIVGGVSSVIFGGLGGGIGTAIGAMHGPWSKVGDAMGAGIRKITGDWPGWEATEEQKYQLEKMVGQVNETERPTIEELEGMTAGDGADGAVRDLMGDRETKKGWGESARGLLPDSWRKKEELKDFGNGPVPASASAPAPAKDEQEKQDGKGKENGGNDKRPTTSDGYPQAVKKKPRKLETRSQGDNKGAAKPKDNTTKQNHPQESTPTSGAASRKNSADAGDSSKRQPRKINGRSQQRSTPQKSNTTTTNE
ncbi:hypothetical protein BDZ85DRAFT_300828 [Elsinoe ampelina]|uniref:Ketoreductase domain-containing protein n=1 Tax=Elsinoe ampelina TaxID=302913 RepID=A0A6A6GQE7_9PEZI|nr:hypothetical protein BDZ85DRAFT_300828 [Elsinoe ampelina]